MGDRTLSAYLLAVAASALAMDLAFLIWASDLGDFYNLMLAPADLLLWVVTCLFTLAGSSFPAAVMVGISQRRQIRSLWFFLFWSCAWALILAYIACLLLWSPPAPPEDPDYLSFERELDGITGLFECGGLVGGLAYWAALRWLSWGGEPPSKAPPAF